MKQKQCLGFNLIELLITLVIIGILVGIIYPSYTAHMVKVYRSNGTTALMDLASRLEEYYNDHHSYTDANLIELGVKNNDFYQLEITAADEESFLIKAVPLGVQAEKDQCGTLILDNLGNESVSGLANVENCW